MFEAWLADRCGWYRKRENGVGGDGVVVVVEEGVGWSCRAFSTIVRILTFPVSGMERH